MFRPTPPRAMYKLATFDEAAPAATAVRPEPVLRAVTDMAPLIARQAIVDEERAVVGYELFNRARSADSHTATSDAALLFNALSHAGTDGPLGSKTVFLNCTYETLTAGHLDLIHPDRVVLEVAPPEGNHPADIALRTRTLVDLQKRGFRFAFNHTVLTPAYAAWLPMASFIKLDLIALEPEVFERFACAAQSYSTAELIAEKVETIGQFDQVSAYGIRLFQGFWVGTPKMVQTRRVAATPASVHQLIALVHREASTSEFEELFKRDAVLGFNLMHLINTSGLGLGGEVRSFGQAVRTLGPKRLYRWATLMLTASYAAGAPPAVGSMAVVRGRLMELLATEVLPPEETDKAYMVGAFSLLGEILGEPLHKTLALLALPPAVTDALIYRSGVFAPLLALTEACESNDEAAFTRLATVLNLSSRQVNWAHLQALEWANDTGL